MLPSSKTETIKERLDAMAMEDFEGLLKQAVRPTNKVADPEHADILKQLKGTLEGHGDNPTLSNAKYHSSLQSLNNDNPAQPTTTPITQEPKGHHHHHHHHHHYRNHTSTLSTIDSTSSLNSVGVDPTPTTFPLTYFFNDRHNDHPTDNSTGVVSEMRKNGRQAGFRTRLEQRKAHARAMASNQNEESVEEGDAAATVVSTVISANTVVDDSGTVATVDDGGTVTIVDDLGTFTISTVDDIGTLTIEDDIGTVTLEEDIGTVTTVDDSGRTIVTPIASIPLPPTPPPSTSKPRMSYTNMFQPPPPPRPRVRKYDEFQPPPGPTTFKASGPMLEPINFQLPEATPSTMEQAHRAERILQQVLESCRVWMPDTTLSFSHPSCREEILQNDARSSRNAQNKSYVPNPRYHESGPSMDEEWVSVASCVSAAANCRESSGDSGSNKNNSQPSNGTPAQQGASNLPLTEDPNDRSRRPDRGGKKKNNKSNVKEVVVEQANLPGYKGDLDIDTIVQYLEGPTNNKKKKKLKGKKTLVKSASLDENDLNSNANRSGDEEPTSLKEVEKKSEKAVSSHTISSLPASQSNIHSQVDSKKQEKAMETKKEEKKPEEKEIVRDGSAERPFELVTKKNQRNTKNTLQSNKTHIQTQPQPIQVQTHVNQNQLHTSTTTNVFDRPPFSTSTYTTNTTVIAPSEEKEKEKAAFKEKEREKDHKEGMKVLIEDTTEFPDITSSMTTLTIYNSRNMKAKNHHNHFHAVNNNGELPKGQVLKLFNNNEEPIHRREEVVVVQPVFVQPSQPAPLQPAPLPPAPFPTAPPAPVVERTDTEPPTEDETMSVVEEESSSIPINGEHDESSEEMRRSRNSASVSSSVGTAEGAVIFCGGNFDDVPPTQDVGFEFGFNVMENMTFQQTWTVGAPVNSSTPIPPEIQAEPEIRAEVEPRLSRAEEEEPAVEEGHYSPTPYEKTRAMGRGDSLLGNYRGQGTYHEARRGPHSQYRVRSQTYRGHIQQRNVNGGGYVNQVSPSMQNQPPQQQQQMPPYSMPPPQNAPHYGAPPPQMMPPPQSYSMIPASGGAHYNAPRVHPTPALPFPPQPVQIHQPQYLGQIGPQMLGLPIFGYSTPVTVAPQQVLPPPIPSTTSGASGIPVANPAVMNSISALPSPGSIMVPCVSLDGGHPYIGHVQYDGSIMIPPIPGVNQVLYYPPPNYPVPTPASLVERWMDEHVQRIYQKVAQGKLNIYRV